MPIEYEKDTENPAPPESDAPEIPQWSVILEAPDYAKLLRPVSTARAKEYETRVLSLLKEILRYKLTPDGLPDAAAILAHGPDFAARTGVLADHDPNVAKVVDMLTAPDSPWIMFALVAVPFAGQLFRNHEAQIKAIPANMKKTRAERKAERANRPRAEIRIPGTKRVIRVPFRIRLSMGLRVATEEPVSLVNRIMGNPDIRKALHKSYGVTFGSNSDAPSA